MPIPPTHGIAGRSSQGPGSLPRCPRTVRMLDGQSCVYRFTPAGGALAQGTMTLVPLQGGPERESEGLRHNEHSTRQVW